MYGRGALIGIAVMACGAGADAADRHVPEQYPTIQAAIDAALPGDTVVVADGVYTGDGNRDLTFDGKAITVRSESGPLACVIDCKGSPENPFRGFHFGSGETPESVLRGFTICNGATPPGAIIDVFNGAGILITNDSSPTIVDCIIRDNACGCWGGGVSVGFTGTASNPTLINCTISGNFSGDDGGAFFALGGGGTLINCTLTNNGANSLGGGVSNFGSTPVMLVNCTLSGNDAPYGAAIHGWNSNVIVTSSIIRNGSAFDPIYGTPSISYSNVEGGYAGIGNIDVDPMFVDDANGDYHLQTGSPMIDAGDPSFVGAPGDVDPDGHPRVINGIVDMGADEALKQTDFNGDGFVNVADLLTLLAAWGPCVDCTADVNGDDVVNVADLLQLFMEWGP